jgi:crotonobetaine/carnitine-CoA ligase
MQSIEWLAGKGPFRSVEPRALRAGEARARGAARAILHMAAIEHAEGTLKASWEATRKYKFPIFVKDWTYAHLLEWAADRHLYRTFIDYEGQVISFNDMNRRANRVARRLMLAGIGRGHGVAIMMSNHPRFLETFFAVQKIGGYAVPVNAGLIGEGLAYVLNHSEVRAVVADHDSAAKLADVRAGLGGVKQIFVSTAEAPAGYVPPAETIDYVFLERGNADDGNNLGRHPNPSDPSLLLYTSGTTGLPKAVVTPYSTQRVKGLGTLAHMTYSKEDKLYTCLPLYHANALILTIMQALWVGIPVRLSKRFSVSRFWKEVSESGATQLNTVGSMIPMLLKSPPSEHDRGHKVKRILSAACPKDAWVPFEQRFGVDIWEGYGAVDGAGVTITNMGNAPVGSLGKPPPAMKYRLVTDRGGDAAPGEPGELWVQVGTSASSRVQYFKNEKASDDKVRDGWLHTGDLMQKDADGFLYFVGRGTDSMRHRGENVSAYEVEKEVDAHPDVLESAAFGVPSPVGEQDIMIAVVPVEGRTIDPKDLLSFLQARLPRYAVPSYLDIVPELPKTGTHRVVKADLRKRGVTASTIRLDGSAAN